MTYDWDGVRTRRIKIFKLSISAIIVLLVLSAPAMILIDNAASVRHYISHIELRSR